MQPSSQPLCIDMLPYAPLDPDPDPSALAKSFSRRVTDAQQHPDFVLWSLFNFIFLNFCCLGFTALVFSIKSRDRKVAGDPDGAASYGKTAKCLNITTSLILCILFIIIIGLVIYFVRFYNAVNFYNVKNSLH